MLLQIAETAQITSQVTRELLEKGATTSPATDPSGSLLVMCLLVGGIFFMLMCGLLVWILVAGKKASPAMAVPAGHSKPDDYEIDHIKTLTRIELIVAQILSNQTNERVSRY